jgi:excisionase family DNA binding protein
VSDYLTPEELAETLQVPRSWVMAAAKRGELPHLKIGRYTRFTAAQVEEIIASHTVTAREELPNPWGRVTRRGR